MEAGNFRQTWGLPGDDNPSRVYAWDVFWEMASAFSDCLMLAGEPTFTSLLGEYVKEASYLEL